MPSVRDFLERLRPSGTPGAAALSGVPADRVAERSAELEPVLARLADAQAEASQIRRAADDEAQRRRVDAATRASALVAEARRMAEAERRDAAARAHARAATETHDRLEDAASESASIADVARAREPALVDRVVQQARAHVSELLGGAP